MIKRNYLYFAPNFFSLKRKAVSGKNVSEIRKIKRKIHIYGIQNEIITNIC